MDILEKARAHLGSDAAVARYLKVTPGFISNVRNGVRPLPPHAAARLAELLEMNPAHAYLTALEAQYEKKEEARFFKRWFARALASGVVALVAVGLSGGFPTSAEAANLKISRGTSTLAKYTMVPHQRYPIWSPFRALRRNIQRVIRAIGSLGAVPAWRT